MGLDMYLHGELYVGGQFEHRKVRGRVFIEMGEGAHRKIHDIPLNTVTSIEVLAGYWRKDNHIHKWFVDNCQDGKDECQRSEVSRDQLRELWGLCEQVLNHRELAPDKLPPQEGFFFGGTEFDDYYFQALEDTIEICKKALKLSEDGYEIYYRSSW